MQYLLLIYENELNWGKLTPPEAGSILGQYVKLTEGLSQSGHYKGGNPLEPTRTATTVRVQNGKVQTTDGPFAETREQLGGYFLIDANDLDEAIGIAARIPAAATGSIEIRPIRPKPAAM
ncbi:MAG TPA: YciI family protein [Gemmatimonadaceae bacterium]|jgi:hypothetical protein